MNVREKANLSIFPIFFAILAYVFALDQLYVWVIDDLFFTNTLSISAAIGAMLVGILSDAFCRRRTLITIHFLGALFFILFYLFPGSPLFLVLFGISYNPLPIVRANLIDNAITFSKIKLISASFIIQFLPDTFYFLFLKIPKHLSFKISISLIVACLTLGVFLFFDRRDKKIEKRNLLSRAAFFLPNTSRKAILTLIAFVPTQLAYFVSDNLLEVLTLNPVYYSILSFSALTGAAISTVYKKTPHASVLTISYGLCLIISCLPLSAFYLYGYTQLDIPFMFVVLGSLLGFYLPFVYDVVLHAVNKDFRGSTCGLLDFIYASASLATFFIFKNLTHLPALALGLIIAFYFTSMMIQRASEEKI